MTSTTQERLARIGKRIEMDELDRWAMNGRPHRLMCKWFSVPAEFVPKAWALARWKLENRVSRQKRGFPEELRSKIVFDTVQGAIGEVGVALQWDLELPNLEPRHYSKHDLYCPNGSTIDVKSVARGFTAGYYSYRRIESDYAVATEVDMSSTPDAMVEPQVQIMGWVERERIPEFLGPHHILRVDFVPWTKMNLGFLPPSVVGRSLPQASSKPGASTPPEHSPQSRLSLEADSRRSEES